MSDADSDVLGKADALMRRHRVFVAGSTPPEPEGAPSNPDDDLPVLTEVVTDIVSPAAVHDARREAIREELKRWLDEELPQAVLKVTDGLADQLVGSLTRDAEAQLLPRILARLDGKDEDGR